VDRSPDELRAEMERMNLPDADSYERLKDDPNEASAQRASIFSSMVNASGGTPGGWFSIPASILSSVPVT
jgi:hypothetical protein